jgi:hypothetical protein
VHNIQGLAMAMDVFKKYEPRGLVRAASKDCVYCCEVGPEKMDSRDAAVLESLGWLWDDRGDGVAGHWCIHT